MCAKFCSFTFRVYKNTSQFYRSDFAKIRDVGLNWVIWQVWRNLLPSSEHKDTRLYGVTPRKTVILPLTTVSSTNIKSRDFPYNFSKVSLISICLSLQFITCSHESKKKKPYVETTSVRLSATKTIYRIFMKLGTVLHKAWVSRKSVQWYLRVYCTEVRK